MIGRYRKAGLTLVDVVCLWVMVALIVILVFVVFGRRLRPVAYRMTCGANLAGLGKAMLIYTNDYEHQLLRAGGPGGFWATRTPNWMATDRLAAYGMPAHTSTRWQASISASLYLLVKYSDLQPKSFVCAHGEPKTKPFDPVRYRIRGRKLTDLWDFGPDPARHVSYAYQQVYGPHRLTTDGDPHMAIAADRNPWMDSPLGKAGNFSLFAPDVAPFHGTTQAALQGNARAHRGDGQNVLFLDSHVEFTKRAFCAIDDDNIYTSWDGSDKVRGLPAQFGSVPADANDSLLVNDPPIAVKRTRFSVLKWTGES